MLIPIHEVKLCAHCNTWSEALCSLRNMERSFMLYSIQEVKLYAHCYTSIEALYMK